MADGSMRDALQTWISGQLGRPTAITELRRIATGHSRAMWFLTLDDGQRLVARVDQGGVFGTTGVDEFPLMRAAGRLGCPVATVRWLEPTGAVLGQPFFVMDFVESAAVGREDRSLSDAVAHDFVARTHELHGVDWRSELPSPIDPDAATHAQIERWYGIYRTASATPSPLLEEAAAWLHRHAPTIASRGPSIVHGDPGPGNFLHDGERVVAFTDWEFAHLGDPMEDWAYVIAMRGARTMPADTWRALIADVTGVQVTDAHLRYWSAFNFFKGACANLTCLDVFAGANPAPNMAIIGTALQQTFLRRLADLVAG
jgi:aminoglycoside phosphotransferase (APT) family kinase protein